MFRRSLYTETAYKRDTETANYVFKANFKQCHVSAK